MKNVVKTVLTYAGSRTYQRKDGTEGVIHKFLDSNMNPMELGVIEPVAPDITSGRRVGVNMILDNSYNQETKKYTTRNYIKNVIPVVED